MFVPGVEEVEVRLVLIPVIVTTADGRPVLDLVQEDFELLVDGSPQVIATFDPPLSSPPGPVAAVPSAEQPAAPPSGTLPDGSPPASGSAKGTMGEEVRQSWVAVALDRYMTSSRGVARGFSALRSLVENGLPPSTRVGVFVLADGSFETLVPFTDDAGLLQAAVEASYQDKAQIDDWLREEGSRAMDVVGARRMGKSAACSRIAIHSMRQASRVRNVLRGLESLAGAMADLRGRKNVVLLSDGIRARAGLNYAHILNVVGRGERSMEGYDLAHCASNLTTEFAATTRLLKTANVALSPVNLLGSHRPEAGDPGARDEQFGTARFLAEETGGRSPRTTNGFGQEVISAVEEPLLSYLLGFHPDPGPPGSGQSLEVRVRRAGVRITSRTEYVVPRENFGDQKLFSRAALLPDLQEGLAIDGAAYLVPLTPKTAELHVQIAVPTTALTGLPAEKGRRKVVIQMNGLLRDSAGRAEEIISSSYTVRFDPHKPPRYLVLQEAIPVRVKRPSELVLVVIDRLGGETTTRNFTVEPLGRATKGLIVSAPLLFSRSQDDHVLTPLGEPLFSRELPDGRYLPAFGRYTTAEGPGAAMARVLNLPLHGTVHFCTGTSVGAMEDDCVEAEIIPDASTPGEARVTAWVILPPPGSPGALRVQVRTASGQVQAESQPVVATIPDTNN